MRESSGSTKPIGAMKVKGVLGASEGRIRRRRVVFERSARRRRRTAGPSRSPRRRGGARAYTLGPERW